MDEIKKMKPKYGGFRLTTDEGEKAEKARQAAKKDAASKNAAGRPTFAYFATHDEVFRAACDAAGIQPTARQASKWHRQRGRAYEAHLRGGKQ